MEIINVKVKRWGNSLGVIIPKEVINNQDIKEGKHIELVIKSKKEVRVEDVFGILKGKLKKSTFQIMKEVDKDLWGIEK